MSRDCVPGYVPDLRNIAGFIVVSKGGGAALRSLTVAARWEASVVSRDNVRNIARFIVVSKGRGNGTPLLDSRGSVRGFRTEATTVCLGTCRICEI